MQNETLIVLQYFKTDADDFTGVEVTIDNRRVFTNIPENVEKTSRHQDEGLLLFTSFEDAVRSYAENECYRDITPVRHRA